MPPKPPLILSSSSPARRALLMRLKLPFSIVAPEIDETPLPNEDGKTLVQRLAQAKASVTGVTHPNSLIIGCDQVGALNGILLNKPLTHPAAVEQLRFVSGNMVRFYTGLCLLDSQTQTSQYQTAIYDVYFRPLSGAMIEDYLQQEKPYHCAGSFQAEGLGITLIHKFAGDDYTALIGLPLITLSRMLEKCGYRN